MIFFIVLNVIILFSCFTGASFAENFYDLKRVQLKSSKRMEALSLSRKVYLKSLSALVAFPYIRERIDNVFQEVREKDADGLLNDKVISFRRFLLVSFELRTAFHYKVSTNNVLIR